jgi:hypothetical protein
MWNGDVVKKRGPGGWLCHPDVVNQMPVFWERVGFPEGRVGDVKKGSVGDSPLGDLEIA